MRPLVFMMLLLLGGRCQGDHEVLAKSEEYWEKLKKTERTIIEKTPIWEDFSVRGVESELRKFLLPHHLQQAKHFKAIRTDSEIEVILQENQLISLESDHAGWFFYNVPAKYRYGRPEVLQALRDIEAAIARQMQLRNADATLKFAISSAIRPVSYQKNLRDTNENAAIVSSHSYGLSVDIFYDEYFVAVAPPEGSEETKQFLSRMRTRTGYLLGAALRRQLRTILTEALLELQRQGKIYVILEKNQRCYHVTPVIHQ